jgi:hypothetical protein
MRPVAWVGKWVALLRDRKRRIETAAKLVGDELVSNAEAVSTDRGMADLRTELRTAAWEKHSSEVLGLRDAELVAQVRAAYADLGRTVARGASPPAADLLTDLGERLRAAGY